MKSLTLKLANETEELELENIYKTLPLNKMFPLIGSKILEQQSVYCLCLSGLDVYLVVSSLGFCQLIHSAQQCRSEQILNQFLSEFTQICNILGLNKLRLYPPVNLNCAACYKQQRNVFLSPRNRYVFPNNKSSLCFNGSKSRGIQYYTAENLNLIRHLIPPEFIDRFWGHWNDFIALASPVVVTHQGNFASICYSAAVFDGYSEVDIYTANNYRNQGFAKEAARQHIQDLREKSMTALWDCFGNNLGSVYLAKSLGFHELARDYPFYTASNISND